MSHHKFSNLREFFNGDLTGKDTKNLISTDFMDRDCNCNKVSKVEGKCAFGGNCRKCIAIYHYTYKCGGYYIGNTQNHVKQRMTGHFAETCDLVDDGGPSDTFAKYFVTHFDKCDSTNKKSKEDQINANQARRLCKIDNLWEGNPISCMKSFSKLNCSLRMNERLQILKAQKSENFSKTKKTY